MEQLPNPVVQYLGKLELELKQRVGVCPEDALSDAREHICREYTSLLEESPDCSEESAFEHFVASFGSVEKVADQFESTAKTNRTKIPGYAPGWRISCSRCGRSAPAAKAGITRIGAFSFGKCVGGWCKDCRRFRWFHLTKDLDRVTLTTHLGIKRTAEQLRNRRRPWLITVFVAMVATFLIVRFAQGMAPTEVAERFLEELPEGWQVTQSMKIPTRQTAAIARKLGIRIQLLTNNRITDGNGVLQINAIHCPNPHAAQNAYQSLVTMHSNPRDCIVNKTTVYELIRRSGDTSRLYADSRYRLGLQPKEQMYEIQFAAVPVSDGDPMAWNKLFNLFLAREANGTALIDERIKQLAKSFVFSKEVTLRDMLDGGGKTSWMLQPTPNREIRCCGGDARTFVFSRLPTLVELPVIKISGQLKSTTGSTTTSNRTAASELLAATKFWPVDDPVVQELSSQITTNANSAEAKVAEILQWFQKRSNIRFAGETGSRYGVQKTLRQRFGHCWDYADVFTTICRSTGIPCRQVYGWLHRSEGHVWCEVMVNGKWKQIDPTTGTICGSDYIPIVVSEDGAMPFVYASKVQITTTAQ